MCRAQGDQGIAGDFLPDLRLQVLTVSDLSHELFEILFAHGLSPSMRPLAVTATIPASWFNMLRRCAVDPNPTAGG